MQKICAAEKEIGKLKPEPNLNLKKIKRMFDGCEDKSE
jgi:hypothetical protein